MSPFDNSAKRIFQPTSKIWSVTSSQVVYFQHPLPPKKLRRGKPARRLAARSHRLFNPASAGGQADLRDSSPSPSTASPGILGEICKTRGTQGNPLGNKSEVFSFLALPCYPIIRFF